MLIFKNTKKCMFRYTHLYDFAIESVFQKYLISPQICCFLPSNFEQCIAKWTLHCITVNKTVAERAEQTATVPSCTAVWVFIKTQRFSRNTLFLFQIYTQDLPLEKRIRILKNIIKPKYWSPLFFTQNRTHHSTALFIQHTDLTRFLPPMILHCTCTFFYQHRTEH